MAQAVLPFSVAGFTPIPVSYSDSSTHVLYARAHTGPKKPKTDSKGKAVVLPEDRTLFLVNVPPDATERELTLFFKSSGTVEKVLFVGDAEETDEPSDGESDSDEEQEAAESDAGSDEDANERPRKKRKKGRAVAPQVVPLPSRPLRTFRRTGGRAHVVFLDASSLARALTPPTKPKPWPTDTSVPLGLAHYTALYASLRPPLDTVKAHADTWMAHFDFEEAKKKQESKYKKGEAIVDEDGFTLVARGGAYGKTLGGDVGVASKKFQNQQQNGGGKRNRKKNDKKEKEGFYSFQIHEKRRKELMDLKKKWEEDKANVEKLKQSRKFKPY
ncbi:predicted protein [Sparassis crispa]|uniref:Ribosomal RNA-processing protein n=1 Tax=Sparassis crispa TaxID=139825 RepID=A0A401GDG1_9APHY|nr:predicted protein [Sparassis crispa]GBE80165.1 predicted protein [Sparassis crispa]